MSDSIVRPVLLPSAVINKRIDRLNTHAAKLQDAYQDVAVQALMHLEAHGDVGPVNRLVVGMPKGLRRNAMAGWFMAHGNVEVNQDAGTKQSMPLRYTAQKECKVDLALTVKWYEMMPEKPIDEVFDLSKAINALLSKCKDKDISVNGKQLSGKEALDKINALKAFAAVS